MFLIAVCCFKIWDEAVVQRVKHFIELAILSALILATRCANYPDVFVGGNIFFTDADCYARMTRVRMCAAQPGLIVRHHDFENFPAGTTPHTTAPLDYLILGLSVALEPISAHAVDLAGALISPLLALAGGWFLWWWSRQMKARYRWASLILYAISPILVHGTELGRPDHHSLCLLLVLIAICAEWTVRSAEPGGETGNRPSQKAFGQPQLCLWSAVGGAAWAAAIWVSAYEPLILFLTSMAAVSLEDWRTLCARHRRIEWMAFGLVIAIALLIEQRLPTLRSSSSGEIFRNWTRTIGELAPVTPASALWLRWCGYLILVAPLLMWMNARRASAQSRLPIFMLVLLIATCALTIWQARWSYFFVLLFALALPALLEPIRSPLAVWIAFLFSLAPILREWDETLWPRESRLAARLERRNELLQLRQLAPLMQSRQIRPFLAPWWLSPAIAYWSGQPGVAGSSHESMQGIADSARFFLSENRQETRQMLSNHNVSWVVAYDGDRVAQNSAVILGCALPARPLCQILDRTPGQAPDFLELSAQNGAAKLYRVKPAVTTTSASPQQLTLAPFGHCASRKKWAK